MVWYQIFMPQLTVMWSQIPQNIRKSISWQNIERLNRWPHKQTYLKLSMAPYPKRSSVIFTTNGDVITNIPSYEKLTAYRIMYVRGDEENNQQENLIRNTAWFHTQSAARHLSLPKAFYCWLILERQTLQHDDWKNLILYLLIVL